MKINAVFCDMDGCLTDFVGGACKAHGQPNPWKVDPSKAGTFDLAGMLGLSRTAFYRPLDSHEFWANMEPTAEFGDIASRLAGLEVLGIPTYVLTKPTLSSWCLSGKHAWIKKNIPSLERHLIVAANKSLLAGPGRLLIDDTTEVVQAWKEAGGEALLFPRPWNTRHKEQAAFDFAAELEGFLRCS
jgi:5' nucleotidase, deoxy (Pyrimidine), cytosolic type C protein (NT5C)